MSLTVPIEEVLPISKTKFVDLVVVLSSSTKKTFYKAFSWSKRLIDQITAFTSINCLLNLRSLYRISVNLVKLSDIVLTRGIIVSIDVIWYLKVLSARILIVFVDSIFWKRPSWVKNNLFIISISGKRS